MNEDSTGRRGNAAAKPGNPATGRGCHVAESACFSSMNEGWIKLHRKIADWEWYTDAPTVRLFIHLLLFANHAPRNWKGIELKRGQMLTGRLKLASALGISERSIRLSLDKLKRANQVTIKSTNRFSIITVTNYDIYQSTTTPINQPDGQPDGQQRANRWPTDGHKQECKNVRIKEGGEEEVIPPNGRESEIPVDSEVLKFAAEWPGQPSTGVPPVMERWWVEDWLQYNLGKQFFPQNWKRVIVLKYCSDWRSGKIQSRSCGTSQTSKKIYELESKLKAKEALAKDIKTRECTECFGGQVLWSKDESKKEYEALVSEIKDIRLKISSST